MDDQEMVKAKSSFTREQEAQIAKIQRYLQKTGKNEVGIADWSCREGVKEFIFTLINTMGFDKDLVMESMKRNKIYLKDFPSKKKPGEIFGRRGQAEDFITKQPVFYDRAGLWWLWDSSMEYWKLTDEVDVLNGIQQELNVDVIDSKSRTEILNSLKQEGRKYQPVAADPKIIQFKNGLVHLDDPSAMIIPNPRYFITNPLPYNLGESDETPTMDKIFEEWVGKEYVQTLYEIIAYGLVRDYPLKRIFCFPGVGNNGKGCYFNLIANFVGKENIVTTEIELLSQNRFEVYKLYKKLFCFMSETDEVALRKTLWLKKLSGNDLIDFERKHAKETFRDTNHAKLMISTNLLPPSPDQTVGWYDRWFIIDFVKEFDGSQDILETIPEIEYENLGKKCVNLLIQLLSSRKFTNQGDFEERKKRYIERSDPLGKFLEEFTDEDLESHIWRFDFEKKFRDWCIDHNHKPVSESAIGRKMKDRNVDSGKRQSDWLTDGQKKQFRTWEGIKWKLT